MTMPKMGNILILGDSYSTYEGHIPEGNWCYYFNESEEESHLLGGVEKTWWYPLVTAPGNRLVLNESYSGSTVSNTRYNNEYCPLTSFNGRLDRFLAAHPDDLPDTVLVFGGTNDNWAGSPLGEQKYENWSDDDLRCFFPALCRLFCILRDKMPHAKVYAIANTDMRDEVNRGIEDICRRMQVPCLFLHDIEKKNGHPDPAGMASICEQVAAFVTKA